MVLNGDNIKWFSDIVHLGHHFNCCLTFTNDTNPRSKNYFISHIAKVCFKNGSTTSGCTVSKILNEYDVDLLN